MEPASTAVVPECDVDPHGGREGEGGAASEGVGGGGREGEPDAEGVGGGERGGACGASSEEEDGVQIGLRKLRKRGARILDDSDSDSDTVTKNRNSGDVILAKVGPDETPRKKSVSSALAAFGACKKLKRFSFKKLSVRAVRGSKAVQQSPVEGSEAAVIDLTDDPSSSTTLRPASGVEEQPELAQEEEERVVCPLCSKSFAASTIETHAADCQGPSPVTPHPSRPAPSSSSSSLLTPRFSR